MSNKIDESLILISRKQSVILQDLRRLSRWVLRQRIFPDSTIRLALTRILSGTEPSIWIVKFIVFLFWVPQLRWCDCAAESCLPKLSICWSSSKAWLIWEVLPIDFRFRKRKRDKKGQLPLWLNGRFFAFLGKINRLGVLLRVWLLYYDRRDSPVELFNIEPLRK